MQTRPECICHWQDVEGNDDAGYPDSNELMSIGAPLAKRTGLTRLGIHHERLPPGRRTSYPHAESSEEECLCARRVSGGLAQWRVVAFKAGRQRRLPGGHRPLPHLYQ